MPIMSFEEFSKGQPVKRLGVSSTTPSTPAAKKKPGLFERIAGDWGDRADNVAEVKGSDQNLLSKGLQTLGQSAAFLGDVAGEAVSAVTPDAVGAKFVQGAQAVMETEPVQDVAQGYAAWKAQHPEAAANLEAVVNIGSTIPMAKGVQLGAQGAKVGAQKAAGAASEAAEGAIRGASDAVSGLGAKVMDAITPVEKGVETIVKNPASLKGDIAEKFARYKNQAEIAIKDYSQPTPLELAGDEGARALKLLSEKLSVTGKQKRASLGEVANKTVSNIGAYRASLRDNLRDRVGVNLIVKDGKVIIEEATGRASKVAFDAADNKLMIDAYTALAKLGKRPTVQMLDDTVDALQDLLYKRKQLGAVPVNGQVESVLKAVTRQLNEGVKKIAGPEYAKVNTNYSRLKNTFDILNKALGVDGNKGASLMKQLFSPSGTAPRKLFDRVKQETGIDLVQEATFAKFVMENIGDVRQASLLEQVLRGNVSPTPSGVVGKAVDFLVDKATDPVKKVERMIDSRPD